MWDSFRTFPCLSFVSELPFLLSPSDTGRPRSVVTYLYLNPLAWPRPRRRASSNPCNLRPLFPLLARVPSPQDSRYARYDPPRAFSASRERALCSTLASSLSLRDRKPTLDLGTTSRTHQRGLTTRATGLRRFILFGETAIV